MDKVRRSRWQFWDPRSARNGKTAGALLGPDQDGGDFMENIDRLLSGSLFFGSIFAGRHYGNRCGNGVLRPGELERARSRAMGFVCPFSEYCCPSPGGSRPHGAGGGWQLASYSRASLVTFPKLQDKSCAFFASIASLQDILFKFLLMQRPQACSHQ